MPWSPWQDGPTGFAQWKIDATIQQVVTNGASTVTVSGFANQPFFARTHDADGTHVVRTMSQNRLPAGWETVRNWFPPPLSSLVLGFDYDRRPDRNPGDQDQWVQYEDGDNTALSTGVGVTWDGQFSTGTAHDVTAHVGVAVGTDYVPGVTPAWPGIGPERASLTYNTGAPPARGVDLTGTFSGTELFPTTAQKSFTVGTEDQGVELPLDDGHNYGLVGGASTTYQMPRWRYWRPGDLPLRQRQRDDGLGMSGPPRWRGGSSRQASNRWRGYL